MKIFLMIVAAIISYFIGNFSTGAFIARKEKGSGMDIRNYGSGSSGATNVLRVLGKKPALYTLLGDLLKGIVGTLLGYLVGGHPGAMLCGFMVVLGHIWPVLMQFHGGKGVATAIGVIMLVTPWQGLLVIAVALLCILITRYVSLGDILAAIVYSISICPWAISQHNYPLFFFALGMTTVICIAHRGNFVRLAKGTENRLDLNIFKKK